MKTFRQVAAQGELHIVRISSLPSGLPAVAPTNGQVVVGHSETGHHHVMDAERTTMYRLPEEVYEWFLVVKEPDDLVHLRPFDTHETLRFEPGVYRVRAGRESSPEGWRRSED